MELKRLQESDAELARLAIGRLKIADVQRHGRTVRPIRMDPHLEDVLLRAQRFQEVHHGSGHALPAMPHLYLDLVEQHHPAVAVGPVQKVGEREAYGTSRVGGDDEHVLWFLEEPPQVTVGESAP